jgi:hypothetical protein
MKTRQNTGPACLRAISAALLVATPVGLPLLAQTREDAGEELQRTLVTPSAAAPIRSSVPVFFLAGSAQKTEAQIQGGFHLTDDPAFGDIYATLGLTAELSGQEDEPTAFGGLGGLAGGTTLSLSLTGQRWRWTNTSVDNTAWCRRKVQEKRTPLGYTADQCEDFDLTEVAAEDESLEREFYHEVSTDQPVLYEVSAWYRPEEMSYLDAESFLPATLERGAGAIGASVGRFFGNQLLSVGYRHEVTYREGPSAEVCVPVGGAGAIRCRKAPLGRPVRQRSSVGTVQARGYIRRTLAWNPRFSYRAGDEEWDVEVPFYFVPGESGLVGGVAPGYSSVDGEWSFTVFFGKTFRVRL